jgi:predicted acylesterase/phospholipase RssA
MLNPELWGNLRERYAQKRPRKLLALDGGGIRGVLTPQILGRIEELLASASGAGSSFRLCDYFDYIGGTSTGAIIAAGLARGMSVGELTEFYRAVGPEMFEKTHLLRRLHSLYKSDPLVAKLQQVFGPETTLEPGNLRTLLLVVTRNVTTDSPWPVSSNPAARYNNPQRPDCNLRVPLWQLVRSSTAAPVYFPPEVLNWDPNDPMKTFVFVDGGVTPFNNPAFLLFRMATHPSYLLEFPTGEKNLVLVSVGTGTAPTLGATADSADSNLLETVAGLPTALMYGIQVEQDVACRTVGRCVYGDMIDREVLDMVPREGEDVGTREQRMRRPPVPLDRDLGRAFLYVRYNADLSDSGLDRLQCGDLRGADLRKMDNATSENIEALVRVGKAAASQVDPKHFGPFLP